MSNGTTNVDQANFYGITMGREEREFKEQDMREYITNIDPIALAAELDKNGEFVIETKEIGPKERAAIKAKRKREANRAGNEMTH